MSRQSQPLLLTVLLSAGCALAPPPTTTTLHDKYRVTPTGATDAFEEPADHTALAAVLASGGHAGDVFAGTDRRDAKTSVATGGVTKYSTVTALRASLRSDAEMRALGITKAPDSERTSDEQGNVKVNGFIYAISKESDNDFHLIVGDSNCGQPCKSAGNQGSCFVNVEVSGLPPSNSPDRQKLADVRSKFLAFFNGTDPGTTKGYDKFDPPIPVAITGSLFFDVDHKACVVGPGDFKPNSSWEIHPITDIAFEP